MNNPDGQFLFSGLDMPAGNAGTPGFTAQKPFSADGKYGDVIVERGAVLSSPTNSAKVGGRITLVGPNVTNDGTISTPDGQTILAAGLQAGFAAHASTDPSLRGLDVFIGAIQDADAGLYAGKATQNGLIEAPRGAITIAGASIHQNGVLESSTSVSLNGRIDLLAHYDAISNPALGSAGSAGASPFIYQKSGLVQTGTGSLMRILPEWNSKETAIGSELALRSRVNIEGGAIHLGVDSTLLAPNALVDLTAGEWILTGDSTALTSTFESTTGQVYIDRDALVDVSGSTQASVDIGKNIISVDLRGAELANSPLQRDGKLRNETIRVDIRDQGIYQNEMWVGTPLANVSGFANLIQRTVGELTVDGGEININSGSSVVLREGVKLDVSGGLIHYKAGTVRTTQLITGGRLVDISAASPDVVYDGIYDGTNTVSSVKFGVNDVYFGALAPDGSRFEAASDQGGNGGTLSITAPEMALDGRFVGKTYAGDRQRLTPPGRSTLNLNFLGRDKTYQTLPVFSPAAPDIVFSNKPSQVVPGEFGLDADGNPIALDTERSSKVQLSSQLMSRDGFGIVSIDNRDGSITVPEDVRIKAPGEGQILFSASNIIIDGKITAPGGELSFTSNFLDLDTLNQLANTAGGELPEPSEPRGLFKLGSRGVIDTSGLLVDDRKITSASDMGPVFTAGGSVSVRAFSADLQAGGKIDVSGGATVDPRGVVTYGSAGGISIQAGRDNTVSALIGGSLKLGATLHGFSGKTAGSLTLGAPAFQIGAGEAANGVTVLDPKFFNRGGFGTFSLQSNGLPSGTPETFITGVRIIEDTVVRPQVMSLVASTTDSTFSLRRVLQAEGIRAPGSLSFSASGAVNPFNNTILGRGEIILEQGASIRTDAKGSVSMTGDLVTVAGSIIAPGGSISAAGGGRYLSNDPNLLLPTILIGSEAVLSTAGKRLLIPNAFGLRQGQILAGGTISIGGNIVAEKGSLIDVSGASGVLDLPIGSTSLEGGVTGSTLGLTTSPVSIESNGGSISLSGSRMLYVESTLRGEKGGSSAIGGSLTVSSGRFAEFGTITNTAEINLIVRQDGTLLGSGIVANGTGTAATAPDGSALPGIGNLTVSTFEDGGFHSLSLLGNVAFEGDVNLRMPGSLRLSSGGVVQADGVVRLSAGYVSVGQSFITPQAPGDELFLFTQTDPSGVITPYNFAPSFGSGDLSIRGGLIDIGTVSLQGIGTTAFNAAAGDIRGNGTLSAAGSLDFTAGQIYPTTAGRFDIFAHDYRDFGFLNEGSVIFNAGRDRQLPYSAGGSLNVYASQIYQGGTLRAPIGSIQLGWDGNGIAPVDAIAGTVAPVSPTLQLTLAAGGTTSVSAVDPLSSKGLVIPFGVSLDGNSWIDPSGIDITVGGVPGKSIRLSGSDIITEDESLVDISGGGDLYAYRWVSGNGGTRDVLASNESFAIIPGFDSLYSPFAPFNNSSSATNLGGLPGYVNPALKIGDQVTLAGFKGLPAGTYTLLPARYALLDGAFLVTPKGGNSTGSPVTPEGARIVAGYRSNNLDASRTGQTLVTRFEVASSKVIRKRSEYVDLLASTVLSQAATFREFAVPRLPLDAGYLSYSSNGTMSLQGAVSALASTKGRGGLVDINSASNILINSNGRDTGNGELVLSSSLLNSFGAESILIGGVRETGTDGTTVTVNTNEIRVDTAGETLRGSDLILAAKQNLTIEEGSRIAASGGTVGETLLIGNDAFAGSGDGLLLRASGNLAPAVIRSGVSTESTASLVLGAGSVISASGIVLDSSATSTFEEGSRIDAKSAVIGSGSIGLQLGNAEVNPDFDGLLLGGATLKSLETSVRNLSLASYSTLEVFGSGRFGSSSIETLSLQVPTLVGSGTNGGSVTFTAGQILISNPSGRDSAPASGGFLDGSLIFRANEILLGENQVSVDAFAEVRIEASERILVSGTGSFTTEGDINLVTPLVTGEGAANHAILAKGFFSLSRAGRVTADPGSSAGLGASLLLSGSDMQVNSNILLASGNLQLQASAGELLIGDFGKTVIDVSGTRFTHLDVTRHTDAGSVTLRSDVGSILADSGASISVSAASSGGNAGALNIQSPLGFAEIRGTITGKSGTNGTSGSFTMDVSESSSGSLAEIDEVLNEGGFNELRDYRFRNGDIMIDSSAIARHYRVAADSGSLFVSGSIDASGKTGGTIELRAHSALTLETTASLDVSAADFDSAGKGGSIVLEAGNSRDGNLDSFALLNLQAGSTLDLTVAASNSESTSLGKFTGTLHLRAPRSAGNDEIAMETIGSDIRGASSILVEGVKLYQAADGATIDSVLKDSIKTDATSFLGAAGETTARYQAMMDRITGGRSFGPVVLASGAEIINSAGGLSLGSASSSASEDWNLASYRFGPLSAPGVLTIRAAGNLEFHNALSDGFDGGPSLWLSPLMAFNPLLPANLQTWSLRLTSGADLSASSHRSTLSGITGTGSISLGKDAGSATVTGGSGALTSSILGNLYQVIRTGSGNIDINAAGDIQLLNPFASIYTAGTNLADPTRVASDGDFSLPILNAQASQGNLGAVQQTYAAQYSMAGGNVNIDAGGLIGRFTRSNEGLIEDSSRQMPNNWLYRRGLVGPDGSFGKVSIGSGLSVTSDPSASTTWWVDFSNFFQGVGALGGGNIRLTSDTAIHNIDAVIPTNARTSSGRAAGATTVELGGGDLRVISGGDLSGGLYYVERGSGTLLAGGSITTNGTRSPSFGLVANLNDPDAATLDPLTWLPTTLFVGKSSFDIIAADDILLGPVSNPFLLPQGANNRYWNKTYFSTISADSSVSALSLGGDVSFRNSVILPSQSQAQPILRAWHETQLLLTGSASSTAWLQPWLRLSETSLAPFSPVWSLSASSLSLSSLAGDINLTGDVVLNPSPKGQLELLASGSVNALQPTGLSNVLVAGTSIRSWTPATINLSDANPRAIPSLLKPLASFPQADDGSGALPTSETLPDFMTSLSALFNESGSVTGSNAVLQTRQARHTNGGLHANDSEPLRIYAIDGNLSGLTLFSGKRASITVGKDLTDISFYIQNLSSADNTIVSAGRDIRAFNVSSPLRVEASAEGNLIPSTQATPSGDIQISGPGTLQVLAGRDLDLGIGGSNVDGTGTGITSIGNLRNPFLQPAGADLIVSAGIGIASSLSSGNLDFDAFIDSYVRTDSGRKLLASLATGVDFDAQSKDEQAELALEVFYRILRDTGRNFNDPDSPGYRKYDTGFDAIKSLFSEDVPWEGSILTRGRDIRTRSGGDINIIAPGGSLSMSETTIGNPLTPPGIITESGGKISLFANQSVSIGIGRIFTLRGGDVLIWSSKGDIAAGSSSRTVQSAPPTRVVVDPQSAAVETDLAGLATGGGIGVLATVEGVEPGDVDLIAPEGVIDAGDAGIRVSGNINLAAVTVVNSANISAGGSSTGAPSTSVSAPSISTVTSASNAASATNATTVQPGDQKQGDQPVAAVEETPSVYSVEVIGYGGGSSEEDEEDEPVDNSNSGDLEAKPSDAGAP